MAAVLCIACGAETCSKSRVSFSVGSKRALEPREHVLLLLHELLQLESERRQLHSPPANTKSVKMCRTCFGRYEKCYNLKSELLEKLHVAYDKISPLLVDAPDAVSPESPVSVGNHDHHQVTPQRKRSSSTGKPPAKKISKDHSFSLAPAAAAGSPPVTVSVVSKALWQDLNTPFFRFEWPTSHTTRIIHY